jgi:N-acetylglutamate synthase-like GNAT family acetyltransferase
VAGIVSALTPDVTTSVTIRKASPKDLPEIERLLSEAAERGAHQQLPVRQPGRHHLLVVDAPHGGLAAAALLLIQRGRGRLSMLVVDARYAGLERQVIEMAEALCRAFGARTLDSAAYMRTF